MQAHPATPPESTPFADYALPSARGSIGEDVATIHDAESPDAHDGEDETDGMATIIDSDQPGETFFGIFSPLLIRLQHH